MTRLVYLVNIPRFFVSHRLPLARAARAAGYDVHIATAGDDPAHIAQIIDAGFPFHPLPLSQHGTRPDRELRTLGAVIQLYRRLQPDLVHHVTLKAILYGGLAARLTGVPAAVHAVSGLGYIDRAPGLKAALVRAILGAALRPALNAPNSRVLFQNPDDRAAFIARGLVSAERAALIKGSGVDMAQFQPTPEPDGPPVVLFAGRLLWQKGVGAFVEAAKALRARGVDARFAIVGYPEPSSPAAVPAAMLDTWAGSGAVEWWGRRDDMPAVYAAAHIVCLPSTYGEGVPKVLIEAAACGRPCVATDAPGCREIVHHEETGLVVAPGDGAALAAALARLIADGDLRRSMGARGRALAQAEFSLEQVCAQTLALYESLLSSAGKG